MQYRHLSLVENDEDGSKEDLFRRAAFGWAAATKRLVESSMTLGSGTRVAYTALVDIEYARDLLSKLFVPVAGKMPEGVSEVQRVTPESVRCAVAELAERVAETVEQPPVRDLIAEMQASPYNQDLLSALPKPKHKGLDLSAPVHPRGSLMLWAGVDCSICPSKATERCQKENGEYQEKPHPERKRIAGKA